MIKASKTTESIVSISIGDAITLVRNYLNQHGSREAGSHIAIPADASWFILDEDDNGAVNDKARKRIEFSWIEKA